MLYEVITSNGGATTASAEGQKLDEAGQTVSFVV